MDFAVFAYRDASNSCVCARLLYALTAPFIFLASDNADINLSTSGVAPRTALLRPREYSAASLIALAPFVFDRSPRRFCISSMLLLALRIPATKPSSSALS